MYGCDHCHAFSSTSNLRHVDIPDKTHSKQTTPAVQVNVRLFPPLFRIYRRKRTEMEEFNHKTIFVLDHTQYFGEFIDLKYWHKYRRHNSVFHWFAGISGESTFELDFINNKVIDPPLPICKSLWTTSVETAAEYCRIVWDLFPAGKLASIIVSMTFNKY